MNRMNLSPSLTTPAGQIRALERSDQESPWPGMAIAGQTLGVPLAELALVQLGRYRDLLLQRNAEFNLTAVREASDVERRLFLDAIAMLPAEPSHLDIIWRLWLCGVGFGLFFAPNARLLVGSAPQARAAAARCRFDHT